MKYGQAINLGKKGMLEVNNRPTPDKALADAVEWAMSLGWEPRIRWWEFWKPRCPEHVRDEYEYQLNVPNDEVTK